MPKSYKGVFDGQAVMPLEPIDLPPSSDVLITVAAMPRSASEQQNIASKISDLAGLLYDPSRQTVNLETMRSAGPIDLGAAQ